jgi:hypothetical protein
MGEDATAGGAARCGTVAGACEDCANAAAGRESRAANATKAKWFDWIFVIAAFQP